MIAIPDQNGLTRALVLACLCGAVTAPATAKDPAKIFNGRDLTGWTPKHPSKNQWRVGRARLHDKDPRNLTLEAGGDELVNAKAHGCDISSTYVHGDAVIELDVMVPKGSNSGVYVMGEYEIQVLDSYGRKKMGPGDMGAIYGKQPALVNACRAPGEWQQMRIDFQAPRFSGGKKIKPAKFVRITLNGKVIQENVVMDKGPTPGGLTGKEKPKGPIMFQGNHGAVAYRNIRVTPLP
ncbi:MAG: DUF1080 domain-containing protein [Phycisphaerae bacterium]|nr:DUF1080 domain-containing protein [Phycisphaerae bacterium]